MEDFSHSNTPTAVEAVAPAPSTSGLRADSEQSPFDEELASAGSAARTEAGDGARAGSEASTAVPSGEGLPPTPFQPVPMSATTTDGIPPGEEIPTVDSDEIQSPDRRVGSFGTVDPAGGVVVGLPDPPIDQLRVSLDAPLPERAIRSVEASRLRNPKIGGPTTPATDRLHAGNSSATRAPTSPTAVSPDVLNAIVPRGEGKSLKSLDLETFGVSRIQLTAEFRAASDITGKPQIGVDSHAVALSQAQRPIPTFATLEPGPVDGLSGVFSAGSVPSVGGEPSNTGSAQLFDTVDSPTPGSETGRGGGTMVPSAGVESQVLSSYLLKDTVTGRRSASDSKTMATEAALNSAGTKNDSIVQMTSEIPTETGGSTANREAHQMRPAQPVKPIDLPVFSPGPVRRVTMIVGESDAGIRVQLSDNPAGVSVRFEAPVIMRAGLEGSVHNLLDSLSREQVPLSDVLFSGRFDGTSDSGRRHQDGARGPQRSRSALTEIEDLDFMTEFETSDRDSLISLTA